VSDQSLIERVTLQELRLWAGVSQDRLGNEMGTSQPAIRKAESAGDPRLSTIRRFVDALGRARGVDSDLEIAATLGEQRFVIELPTAGDTRPTAEARGSSEVSPAMGNHAWRLRAWDDPVIERAMLDGSLVAISADEIGDMTAEPTREELRARLRNAPALIYRGDQAIGMFVTYWEIFRRRMARGDLVAVPLAGRRVAIGEIEGDYEYRSGVLEPRLRHVRAVRWLGSGLPREVLDDDIRRVVNAPGTLCAIGAPDAAYRLRAASTR
jgi:hypothetical protein